MCPDKYISNDYRVNPKTQSGFLLPLALFVIVGIAALGLSISRLTAQSGTDATQASISTAAFYAAESGAQVAMSRLFYSTTSLPSRTIQDANCLGINGSTINFPNTGLNGCTALLSCSVSTDSGNTLSFYSMTSVGSCGSSPMNATRTLQFQSFLEGVAP